MMEQSASSAWLQIIQNSKEWSIEQTVELSFSGNSSLEKWVGRYPLKFNKEKCKIFQLRRNNPRYHYSLGGTLARKQLGKKSSEVSAGIRLNTGHHCVFAAKE